MVRKQNYIEYVMLILSTANINIGERTREIATLKVLGFFDKEYGTI